MNTSTVEYDAFGPWIIEIKNEHPMPQLFVPHYKENQTPLMLFKIPRYIERRNATPTMDLYDYVVGLFDSYIYFLKRVGRRVVEHRIMYTDIQSIKHVCALLHGEVVFYVDKKPITLYYNTVSDDVIAKMTAIISKKIASYSIDLKLDNLPCGIDSIEFLYSNLINEIKATDPKYRLVAYQKKAAITLEKCFFGAKKRLLEPKAFIANQNELIVIEREKQFKPKGSNLSYHLTHIPYHSIKKITISPYKSEQDLKLLRFRTASHGHDFLFETSNASVNGLCKCLNSKLMNMYH